MACACRDILLIHNKGYLTVAKKTTIQYVLSKVNRNKMVWTVGGAT